MLAITHPPLYNLFAMQIRSPAQDQSEDPIVSPHANKVSCPGPDQKMKYAPYRDQTLSPYLGSWGRRNWVSTQVGLEGV